MRSKLLILALVAIAATALLTAACGGDDDNTSTPTRASTQTTQASAAATTPAAVGTNPASSGGATVDITASGLAFDKTALSLKSGDTVTVNLTNDDSTEHSFTVGSTDVTEAEGGENGTGTFTVSSGTTEFHCKYHPTTMKGTISVS